MKRALFIPACLILLCARGYGQQTATDITDDPRFFTYLSEPLPEADAALFYEPVDGSYDVFSRLSEYNFSAVRYVRRGYDSYHGRQYAGGIELGNAITGRPLYSIQSALRYLPSSNTHIAGAGMSAGRVGSLGGIEEYALSPATAAAGGRVVLSASDRTARTGFRASYAGVAGKWGYTAALSRRWGRDAHVDGLFLDETVTAATVERRDAAGGLSLTLLAAPTERSVRGYSTREAFELTGDNLYNPSWGWYDGRQRASRVRRSFTPVAILSGDWKLDEQKTLYVSAGFTGGEESYGGLRWWRDETPLPDYYRNMPSWENGDALTGLWRARDPRVVQVDWQAMADKNLMAGGPGVCIVDADVERSRGLQFAAWVHTRPQRRLETSYGIRARLDRNRYFARVQDLMGAGWVTDVDQYLIDDEHLGALAANDLRNPGRRVYQGGEFGYNYVISRREVTFRGQLRYGHGRWRLQAGAEGGDVSIGREGLYEKELFPGAASCGRSAWQRFFDYTVKLAAGYTVSSRHFVDASLVFANRAPAVRDVFLSPEYCNTAASGAAATAIAGGELSYRLVLPSLSARLTGYYTAATGGTEILSYYDDISSTYCNLVMSGIGKRYYGAELGMQVDFSPRISLLAAAAAGQARYSSDPCMDLYADADKAGVYAGQHSPMKNYRVGGSPGQVFSAELRYRGTLGWTASATVTHLADNYITPDPTRRMARATATAASPEALAAMTAQERFDPATTVGLFVMRTVRVGSGAISGMVSVSNLLDERDMVWAGYEQMRLRPQGGGINRTYRPHDSRYTCAYGRTWYASLIYRFR